MAIDVDAYYRKYGPMVLRRCRRLLSDEAQAVDAMQETFVQLLRHQDRLTDEAPSSLLFRMATNICLNQIRAAGRRREADLGPEQALLEEIACAIWSESGMLARLRLGRLFDETHASTRTIAVMHLLDGLTLEEVAAEVGLSVSGVRKRLRRLRSRLTELEGGAS